jgi:hypothetical protein
MDTARNTAIILPFRSKRRRLAGANRGYEGAAAPALGVEENDTEVNAEWDLLIRVASHAWSWRDPESFDTLERTVTRLRGSIDRDWSA